VFGWWKGASLGSCIDGERFLCDRSHWSLMVICHLRSLLPSSHGKRVFPSVVLMADYLGGLLTCWCVLIGEKKGSPCILHLDPIEGTHKLFEGQIRR